MARFLCQAIAAHDFSSLEKSLLLIVADRTFGQEWGSEEASIPQNHFVKATGSTPRNVRKYLNRLIENNVLEVLSDSKGRKSKVYSINTKIDAWKVERKGVIFEEHYPSVEGPPGGRSPGDPLRSVERSPGDTLTRSPGDTLTRSPGDTLTRSPGDPLRSVERSPGDTLDGRNANGDKGSSPALDLRVDQYRSKIEGSQGIEKDEKIIEIIHRRITQKYRRVTILTDTEKKTLLNYQKVTESDPQRGLECFERAWADLEEWEKKNGRLTYKPFSMFEKAAQFFDQPVKPKVTYLNPLDDPRYYNPDTDPDFQEKETELMPMFKEAIEQYERENS